MSGYMPWITASLIAISFSTAVQAETISTQPKDNADALTAVEGMPIMLAATERNRHFERRRGNQTYYTTNRRQAHAGNPSSAHSGGTHQGKSYSRHHGSSNNDYYYRYPYSGHKNYGYRNYYSGYPYTDYSSGYRYRVSPYGLYTSPYYYRDRSFYYPGYFGVTRPYESFTGGDYSETAWVWSSHGKRPHGAIVGGRIHGQKYYICQANYKNAAHTGKLYNKGCHVTYNGKTVVLQRYKVLVER